MDLQFPIQFPLPADLLYGQLGDASGPDGLMAILNDVGVRVQTVEQSYTRAATAEVQLYLDLDNGSDDNTGESWLSPLKTLVKALQVMADRFVGYNGAINFKGVSNETGIIDVGRYVGSDNFVVIDGREGGVTTLLATRTSTDTDVDYLEDNTLTLLNNQYRGRTIRCKTGVCAGEERNIHSSTTGGRFYVSADWSQNPGVGAEFDIVEEASEFTAADLVFRNDGGGELAFQHCKLSGSARLNVEESQGTVSFSHITLDNPNQPVPAAPGSPPTPGEKAGAQLFMSETPIVYFEEGAINPQTFVREEAATDSLVGLRIMSELTSPFPKYWQIYSRTSEGGIWAFSSTFRNMICLKSPVLVMHGCHANSCYVLDSQQGAYIPTQIGGIPGYRTPTFGGALLPLFPPLLMWCSNHSMSDPDFSNSGNNAVWLIRSQLSVRGSLTGSNNARFGIYGDAFSALLLQKGLVPTLTGAWGPLSNDNAFPTVPDWATALGARSVGSITALPKGSLADTKIITIGDGVRTPVVFELDVAGDGVTPGNVPVDISGDTTSAEVAATLYTALAGQLALGNLAIFPVQPPVGTDVINLEHLVPLAAGDVPITTDTGMTVVGMTGGADLGLVTPQFIVKEFIDPIGQ